MSKLNVTLKTRIWLPMVFKINSDTPTKTQAQFQKGHWQPTLQTRHTFHLLTPTLKSFCHKSTTPLHKPLQKLHKYS